ncbi:uncharacterized protein [Venturia canescens]|uniref:uncharacterized protein n=1 Tax=Venturia canescens TaxID=32260 RepID=UPI001C9BF90F|nr:uncharacterized protein LOC122411265 [Venturia canescens]
MFGILSILALLGAKFSRAQIECYYDGNDFCVSRDDIMSMDLMPGSILLMDTKTKKNNNSNDKFDNLTVDGTMDSALDEMDFHRKRMNEYLCHGFMAEEIFREMRTNRVKRGPDIRKSHPNSLPDFFDEPNPEDSDNDDYNDIGNSNAGDNVTIQHKLLSDEGSSKYKDWLQRTTTLDDVYRHYAPSKKMRKKVSSRYPQRGTSVLQAHNIEEFDGEVTGYAMPAPISPDKTYYDAPDEHLSPSSTGHSYQYSGHEHYPPSNHHHHQPEIVPIIHEEHYYEQPSHHYDDEYWHRPSYHGKEKSHELTIRDFFEIALTALAFLAFGLFIIQLLMNITQNPNTTTAAPIVADADGTRFKRDAQFYGYMNYGNEDLNELSYRVLKSIEAAMVAERDSGRCLRWSLCNDNRHSRKSTGPRKIWLPVWSLGMSWVSGRILNTRAWPTMLESIKASVLGLGGADCSSLYPNCDLASERIKRRRRRRK